MEKHYITNITIVIWNDCMGASGTPPVTYIAIMIVKELER